MIKKEELFVLIKSLSRSEKRYFKLFCAQVGEGSNYLKLFEAIDKQEVYDEALIKKKFKQEKFVQQLHVTKNYLRSFILKSLRNFHGKISKNAEVKDILRNVEILFNKELYKHAETELKRADQIATDFELNIHLIDVKNWKFKLTQTASPHHHKAFKTILKEQEEALINVQNNNDYTQLIVGISNSLMEGKKKKFKQEKLLTDAKNALSLEAKILHYNAIYFRYLESEDETEAIATLYELVDYVEQFPKRIKETPGMYVTTINNLISYLLYTRKFDEALAMILRAKTIYNNWKIVSENKILLKQILRTYNLELEIYRFTGTLAGKQDMIKDVEQFVMANIHKMPQEYLVSFWFQLANINFMQKDFKQALKWVNDLLNSKMKNIRPEMHIHGRLLNLMIHLEQQNIFVLRYFVDGTRRYFKKVNAVEPYQTEMLRFFSKIGRSPLLEYKERFKELDHVLFPENGEGLIEQSILDFIDYKSWVKGKIK